VDKANVSNDTQLVRNLNERMQLYEAENGYKKPTTAHEAFVLTEDFGFIIEKLTPTSSGNDIVWDITTNRFALIDKNDLTKVVYSDPQVTLSTKPVDLWKVYKEVPIRDDQKYSIYLAGTNLNGSVDAKVGVDVGRNTEITEINYVNSDEKRDVVIRTNSTATSLTINGPLDDVKHYGVVGDLTVTAVRSDHCYHENGFVVNLVSFDTGKFVVESTALFHQTKAVVASKFEGETKSYVEGKDAQYSQHVYDAEGVCLVDGCYETTATHVHTFVDGVCACGKEEVTIKNGLVNGYYYKDDELFTGTITDNNNNKTIEFENGCLVVWAEDLYEEKGNGRYVANHTFNKNSVDSKYLTDKIVLSSISSVYGVPGMQTFVSNKINIIDFKGYSVESAKAYDPSIMYSLSSTPWNNETVYKDYMRLISETSGNAGYGDESTFPFSISSKDYTEYNSLIEYNLLSVSELTFTDYLKLKYVSNVIVTSSTTAIETYMIKNGSEDKLSAYAYDNGKAGMGIILSKDGTYFYSWSDLEASVPSYTDISSDGKYSSPRDVWGYSSDYSVERDGATIVVSYDGKTIDTLTITKNDINAFNLVEQKAAISTKSIADSCSKEELLALATDLGFLGNTTMRIDQAPELMELFIKAFWSTYSFSDARGKAACSFDDFDATTLIDNYDYEYVVQFVNGIGNTYQDMQHVGPIIKVIISKN